MLFHGVIRMLNIKSLIYLLFITLTSVYSTTVYSSDNDGIENLRQTSKAFASIAKKVSPSVAFIKVESIQKNVPITPFSSPFSDDFFKRFFGENFPGFQQPGDDNSERRVIGQGTGFIFLIEKGLLSNKSYILTNNHVVEMGDKIKLTFQDGREFDAKIKGTDPKSDIAVLEISDSSHPALEIGSSSNLEVGEWVIAVGNPFGLSHTLTVGVVSAKGRTGLGINDYEDFIQTDAAINPGNSGGPLLNLNGEVVGINTAIFTRTGGYMGVGFAIPVDLANNIATQLIKHGKVTRGYLGIVIQSMTPELAESFNLDIIKGILVSQVSEKSPAEQAGIKIGDVIVRYQDNEVSEIGDFRNQVAMTTPGTRAKLEIIRNSKRMTITATISDLGKTPVLARTQTHSSDELGITVQTVTDEIASQFNIKSGQGVVITNVEPGSLAAMAGLRQGVVILQVNKKEISSATAFTQAIENSKNKKQVLLLINEQGMSRYVVLRWR